VYLHIVDDAVNKTEDGKLEIRHGLEIANEYSHYNFSTKRAEHKDTGKGEGREGKGEGRTTNTLLRAAAKSLEGVIRVNFKRRCKKILKSRRRCFQHST
jgi:hypothetical protein